MFFVIRSLFFPNLQSSTRQVRPTRRLAQISAIARTDGHRSQTLRPISTIALLGLKITDGRFPISQLGYDNSTFTLSLKSDDIVLSVSASPESTLFWTNQAAELRGAARVHLAFRDPGGRREESLVINDDVRRQFDEQVAYWQMKATELRRPK